MDLSKTKWACTRCLWKGLYADTRPVMYRGVDWQRCPSCQTIAIPQNGVSALQPGVKPVFAANEDNNHVVHACPPPCGLCGQFHFFWEDCRKN